MSTKRGGSNLPPFYNNLSYKVGDNENTVSSNRHKFFSSLNIDEKNLAVPKQVHSPNVQIIETPGSYPETDALITNKKNLFLSVSVADCYPVLIYDKVKQVIAAVHSGWRGTQKKILTYTLNKIIEQYNCIPNDLIIFIGPGISKNNFEVGEDVALLFDEKYRIKRNGKYFIDLREDLADQLSFFHIPAVNIEFNPMCTFGEADYLHSYRRDKENSGRMLAVIGMKDENN
ncbi:MAG: peptidoglycan editing factor PgeF [Ignavibacteria bacterium]